MSTSTGPAPTSRTAYRLTPAERDDAIQSAEALLADLKRRQAERSAHRTTGSVAATRRSA